MATEEGDDPDQEKRAPVDWWTVVNAIATAAGAIAALLELISRW